MSAANGWENFRNVLAIRFKGIDPERLLNWLYPKIALVLLALAALSAFV